MDPHNDQTQRLERKRQFYSAIDLPTSEEDETPDPGRQSSIQAMSKAAVRKQAPASKKAKDSGGVSRSASDSNLAKELTDADDQDVLPLSTDPTTATREPGKFPASLQARHTFSGGPSKPMAEVVPSSLKPKITGKRKRESGVTLVPTEQQVFKGLHFYFFPNTDKHPARKLRIAKALEYGATWETDFNDSVTHVIVDKAMDFGLLLKFIKRDKLPSGVVVISENYPAECLSYKMILDPKQLQFKVKGYEMPQGPRPGSSASDKSLQLKPAGKAVIARQPETQSSGQRARTPPPVDSDDDEEAEGAHVQEPPVMSRPVHNSAESTEELDIAIRKARELRDVPLDSDEGDSRPTSSEGPASDDEGQNTGVTLLKQKKNKFQRFQDRFQCMNKNTGQNSNNPNAPTIAILQQMADYYRQIGDEWRIRAYRKAIATLRNHPTKVCTREEALALPQIGDRLATKIEEIAVTNRLRRLDNAKAEPSDQILLTFMGVYGAGYAQSSKWVSAGYTTLDELLQKAELTDNHRIGINHYEDFHSRIPRSEVEQHGKIVRKTLQKIDPSFEVIIGGSYRRGSESSGDIDCIITRPDTGLAHIRQVILDELIPKLFAKQFLVAELAAASREDGSKWHGASQLPPTSSSAQSGPWRRIDLLLVPSDEIGAALIYFTGDDIFNRSLRLLASTKAMRLNQRGLYEDVIRGKGREKLSEGTLVEGKDERRLFEVLGVPWREPNERIC